MKTCINCGAELEDLNNFCPQCGTRCDSGNDVANPVYQPEENVYDTRAENYPMKWHKVLMVIMILGGILTVARGAACMAGFQYAEYEFAKVGANSEVVYYAFPGLKACDMFYGIVLIAIGIFEFTVRKRLKQFRANGPLSLKIMYMIEIAAEVIYLAWTSHATNLNMFTSANLGSLGVTALIMVLNIVYYSRRSSLFIN